MRRRDPVRANAGRVGQQVYRANCFACHGPDGDQVNGVTFKSGAFRHATTDDELMGIVDNGIPGTGMPPTAMPVESRRALVALYKVDETFQRRRIRNGAKVAGDAAKAASHCRRQGRVPRVPSRRRQGLAHGPGAERYRQRGRRRIWNSRFSIRMKPLRRRIATCTW